MTIVTGFFLIFMNIPHPYSATKFMKEDGEIKYFFAEEEQIMTLYDFLEVTKEDFDTYDTQYDAVVTACYIGSETDDYEKFCNELTKKVSVSKQSGGCSLIVNWSELIEKNMEQFKAFTKKYWKENCQYEDDEDEFVYQWIKEFHNYMAGAVSESFYKVLVEFLGTINAVE